MRAHVLTILNFIHTSQSRQKLIRLHRLAFPKTSHCLSCSYINYWLPSLRNRWVIRIQKRGRYGCLLICCHYSLCITGWRDLLIFEFDYCQEEAEGLNTHLFFSEGELRYHFKRHYHEVIQTGIIKLSSYAIRRNINESRIISSKRHFVEQL